MELWPNVGAESGWLGGPGESWERGPYYARGLVALAHTLGDATLADTASRWVEWSLASQGADGFFGPSDNDDWTLTLVPFGCARLRIALFPRLR